MQRRKYLATIGTTVSGLALAGCSGDEADDSGGGDADSNSGDTSNDGSNNGDGDQPDVEILNDEFYEDEFSVGVRGTAVNNTDSELSYVEATATFLDSEGTQIGEGLDNVSDLAAGREWEFDCTYLGDDDNRIEEYELEVSSGF